MEILKHYSDEVFKYIAFMIRLYIQEHSSLSFLNNSHIKINDAANTHYKSVTNNFFVNSVQVICCIFIEIYKDAKLSSTSKNRFLNKVVR